MYVTCLSLDFHINLSNIHTVNTLQVSTVYNNTILIIPSIIFDKKLRHCLRYWIFNLDI